MNFPEVPFDENLFASNTMLKSYWERSTNERPDAIIPDWPSEETTNEPNDAKELRLATIEQFSVQKPETEEVLEFIVPEINVEKKISTGLVEPKMSGTNIAIIIIASIVAFAFFAYLFMAGGRKYFRRV